MAAWEPGDFAVVRSHGPAGRLIHVLEGLSGGHGDWEHAIVGVEDGYIVEAEPGGAAYRPFHYDDADVRWSSGIISLTAYQRTQICAFASLYTGTPYSFLDYAALAAHCWHLPVPGLRAYVASTKHQICSQLVDQCFQDAGIQLFADHRWPGYVRPCDLGQLIGAR